MKHRIDTYFQALVENGGSDLHLSEGQPPKIRIHGSITPIEGEGVLTHEDMVELMQPICPPKLWKTYEEGGDADFAYEMDAQSRFRCNYMKQQRGYCCVFRLIPTKILTLEQLNVPEQIKRFGEMRSGLVLVTGPTGSGKTTTLYAALREINTIDTKILTAEDPVEYDIDGIVQVPINEAIGVTFPRVLRAFLRQDPDRILVGEIRDQDTAQIAIQAALTGHLVLSTLHTNDAAGAVTRFVDMGVQPFLLSATILGVLAQRLVRTICPYCKTPYTPSNTLLHQLGINPALVGQQQFFTGARCAKCANTGYKGRKGIHELLNASDPIRELITQNVPSIVLKQKAIELGMSTLREDGIQNIFEGNTTIEEVLKYT